MSNPLNATSFPEWQGCLPGVNLALKHALHFTNPIMAYFLKQEAKVQCWKVASLGVRLHIGLNKSLKVLEEAFRGGWKILGECVCTLEYVTWDVFANIKGPWIVNYPVVHSLSFSLFCSNQIPKQNLVLPTIHGCCRIKSMLTTTETWAFISW